MTERNVLHASGMGQTAHYRIHSECIAARIIAATHNATHNKDDLHVLRRTYAAVRDLQVVECIR